MKISFKIFLKEMSPYVFLLMIFFSEADILKKHWKVRTRDLASGINVQKLHKFRWRKKLQVEPWAERENFKFNIAKVQQRE